MHIFLQTGDFNTGLLLFEVDPDIELLLQVVNVFTFLADEFPVEDEGDFNWAGVRPEVLFFELSFPGLFAFFEFFFGFGEVDGGAYGRERLFFGFLWFSFCKQMFFHLTSGQGNFQDKRWIFQIMSRFLRKQIERFETRP